MILSRFIVGCCAQHASARGNTHIERAWGENEQASRGAACTHHGLILNQVEQHLAKLITAGLAELLPLERRVGRAATLHRHLERRVLAQDGGDAGERLAVEEHLLLVGVGDRPRLRDARQVLLACAVEVDTVRLHE